jgi:solute carrier family 35 protein E1
VCARGGVQIIAFLVSLPVMFATEGASFSKFVTLATTSPAFQWNLVMSGLTFYTYNELATMTIKKTSAVTSSVANTAKRVIVMVYMAAVTGKALTEEQKIGAGIAIAGVLLYSVIDDLLPKKKVAEKKN